MRVENWTLHKHLQWAENACPYCDVEWDGITINPENGKENYTRLFTCMLFLA